MLNSLCFVALCSLCFLAFCQSVLYHSAVKPSEPGLSHRLSLDIAALTSFSVMSAVRVLFYSCVIVGRFKESRNSSSLLHYPNLPENIIPYNQFQKFVEFGLVQIGFFLVWGHLILLIVASACCFLSLYDNSFIALLPAS